MTVYTIKPAIDTKGNNKIVSRIGAYVNVDHLVKEDENIYDNISNLENHIDCVLVDEVQFLKPEQIDQLLEIATRLNIPVICYGLRTDFQTLGFAGSNRLLQIAHSVEELKTICRCGRKAIFNMRFINGKPVWNGDSVVIDDDSKVTYEAMCASCMLKHKEQAVHKTV